MSDYEIKTPPLKYEMPPPESELKIDWTGPNQAARQLTDYLTSAGAASMRELTRRLRSGREISLPVKANATYELTMRFEP